MKLKIGFFSILMIYLANFEAFLFKFLSGAVQNQKLLSTYDYNRYKYNSKKKQ